MKRLNVWVFAVSLVCTGCDNNLDEHKNIVKNKADDEYSRTWPGADQPALFKLKENLILAIPPEHQQFWLQGDKVVRGKVPFEKILLVPLIGFQMFLPDFSGYTAKNFKSDFDENLIDVKYIEPANINEMLSGAPGYYPANQLNNLIQSNDVNINNFTDLFGLKCFNTIEKGNTLHKDDKADLQSKYCLGEVNRGNGVEKLLLEIHVPPYPDWVKYPMMRTKYFSSKYGGVHVFWLAHIKHLEHWREIDQQVWNYIDAWNIANLSNSERKK